MEEPDLFAPDDATRHVNTGTPSDVVALAGFLGTGDLDNERRVYENLAFQRWVAVKVTDIVGRFSAPGDVSAAGDDDLTAGQSEITVRRDAIVILCESVPVSSFETPSFETPPGGVYRWPRR